MNEIEQENTNSEITTHDEDIPNNENIISERDQEWLSQTIGENFRKIPENSESLLIDRTTSRFSSAVWYNAVREKTIILAGVGGIGSNLGFLLSRMKPKALFIYDQDNVDITNMSGQLYGIEDVGYHKVDALSSMVRNYCDYHNIYAISENYDESSAANNIMICGFDNMRARKVFFINWLNHVMDIPEEKRKDCLFIDGRLAAEEFQVLCIKGDDTYNIKRYQDEFLFSDEEADETICSYKQTSFMANMIAATMANLFVNFVANQNNPFIERDLPFYTVYNAETMYLKTEI